MLDRNDSLRIKVTRRCNLNCFFCHEEGGDKSCDMTPDQTDRIISFAKMFGYHRFHLTGGEPMLHNELESVVERITSEGFPCGITTNGQFNSSMLEGLKKASVTSLNFSLHTVSPADWCQVQQHDNLQLATRQIERALTNIGLAIETGIRTKVNIVVGDSPEKTIEVLERLKGTGAEPRLLNTLGSNESQINISTILDHYSASLVDELRIRGSSQVKVSYSSKIGNLVVKNVFQHRETTICQGCKETCWEGIYGIRLIPTDSDILARLCVHRNSETTLMPLDDFCSSPQLAALQRSGGIASREVMAGCLGSSSS